MTISSWITHKFYCYFTAQGHGAKGENEYKFILEFLEPVKPEVLIIWFGINKIIKVAGKYFKQCLNDSTFWMRSRLTINPLSVKWTSRSRSSRSAGGTVWLCRRRSLCFWLRTSTAGWTSPMQRWSFRLRSEPDRETDSKMLSTVEKAVDCRLELWYAKANDL